MHDNFSIQLRFQVQPEVNIITDLQTAEVIRIESRLMKVLCILAAEPGKPVSREDIINQVWNNYGGGDEGLTQAISALRKILKDDTKQVIQTVPKKGYLLAAVNFGTPAQKIANRPVTGKTAVISLIAAIVLIVILSLIFVSKWNDKSHQKLSSRKEEVLSVPANLDAEQHAGETEQNTIVAQDSSHNMYKWVAIGDGPPRFYINNKALPIDRWEHHMEMIDYLKRKLAERNKNNN